MPTTSIPLEAYVSENCPTEAYPSFFGSPEVWLLGEDGSLLVPIENIKSMEYVRTVNGQYYHGYGYYNLICPREHVPVTEFTLDRELVVVREGETGLVPEFSGLHRNLRLWHDEYGTALFASSGPDYRHLMKRRVLLPTANEDFLTIYGGTRTTMYALVSMSVGAGAPVERKFPNWGIQPFDPEDAGFYQRLNFRYTMLHEELDNLGGLGVDWDVARDGSDLRFETYLPYRGRDLRLDNECGNPPFVLSLDFDTLEKPSLELNRLDEATVAYVGGYGVGRDRIIVERSALFDRAEDSPYNRIETFVDAANDDDLAALAAQGDARLVEQTSFLLFSCLIPPSEVHRYGTEWNLGDRCTGVYEDQVFDMRVVEVRVTIDFEQEQTITVAPTLLVYPGWTAIDA